METEVNVPSFELSSNNAATIPAQETIAGSETTTVTVGSGANDVGVSVQDLSHSSTPPEEVIDTATSSDRSACIVIPSTEMVAEVTPSDAAILSLSDEAAPCIKSSEQLSTTANHSDKQSAITSSAVEPHCHASTLEVITSNASALNTSAPSPPLPNISALNTPPPDNSPPDTAPASPSSQPPDSPLHTSTHLSNGGALASPNGTSELTEVDLLDDDAGAAAGRHLAVCGGGSDAASSGGSNAASDAAGASSPLSEPSDDFPGHAGGGEFFNGPGGGGAGGAVPVRNGVRVDVEMEARLFNLTDKVAALTEEKTIAEDKLKRLQDEVLRLTSENGRERAHIETLEQQLSARRSELDNQREAAAEQARRHQEATRALELDLTGRLNRTRAQFEAALRDKDKMVLRYAQSEKSVIDAKREAAAADKRMREALKEKELLLSKVNHLVQERNKMSQQMETKIQEAKGLTRDSGKMKEEIESRDVRIKWLQNKMKQEADGYKDGQLRMETLLRELREAQETIRQYKLTEDSRSTALDKELREEKARRLVEEKLKQDSSHKERALAAQLQEQQERCSRLAQDCAQHLERALAAESALEPTEAARARLQQEVAALRHQVETLLQDSAELDETRATLDRERERLSACQAEVAALQTAQADLQADLDGCRVKEADLLDFTQKLTEKNVELQSQISGFQARSEAADFESREFSSQRAELEARLADVTSRLAREQEARGTDNQLLARRLAERTRQVEELTKRAEDAENETAIGRKKHRSSVRELQRELAQARRRLESQEPSPAPTPADALSQASRASSNVSLHEAAEPPPVQVAASAPTEPDRQTLIERIVRLKGQVARRNEKIDFLEVHMNGLAEDVRQKSRLLQHYVLREEAGALASQHMDQAKSELMRKGGIMASVYGSQARDQAMTLDLSLEINKKLQSVLEDTLLKNMTLKDNMNVLGQEIASLTEENRRLKSQ
ncbi:coiled-coil domain-containing protein 186-like [Pollicipes pollicipes]|uniref:coiled-coil domain-containing protein 186-like n=1 Tax=Pollicipes pollicipes TaxID=41117 RepID=UPI001884C46C|nr:coiled-coil domain-containing protein 186-like [Pollicipes pollicipes]